MRINRETLLKIANDTISQRTRTDRSIVSAYLSGSLLEEEYLLGGTADIDLTFVHADLQGDEREIVRLTDEIHLDISHHLQKDYRQARRLRLHPWLGPTIFECKPLYDPQHFLDFTQASVRGQFHRADYILGRARQQAEHARQIWLSYATGVPAEPESKDLELYLRAIDHAANSVASLSGPPLTERRLLLKFPQRVEIIERPGLYPGLLGLLGAPNVEIEHLGKWLDDWQAAIEAISPEQTPARLHPHRHRYYRKAFEAILAGSEPLAVLWPLLRTWTQAVSLLPAGSGPEITWKAAFLQLGLLGPAFAERVNALDAYLDMVEETLDKWARENGV